MLLVFSLAGWGLVFVANHELLEVLPPLHISALRFLAVGTAFAGLLAARPAWRPRLSRRDWGLVTLAGLLAVPGAQLMIVVGQQFVAPSLSGLTATSSPAIAAVIAFWFLGERMRIRQVVGVVVALCGVAVVVLFATGTGTDLTVANPAGAALLVVAQVCWASYTVLARSLALRHDPITMVATAFALGSLAFLPWLPAALPDAAQLTASQWWWLFHLVVGGTLFPQIVWFSVLRVLRANEAAAAMYVVPLYATLFGVLLIGERLTVVGLVAGAAILIGVGMAQSSRRTQSSPLEHEAESARAS